MDIRGYRKKKASKPGGAVVLYMEEEFQNYVFFSLMLMLVFGAVTLVQGWCHTEGTFSDVLLLVLCWCLAVQNIVGRRSEVVNLISHQG